MNSDTSRPLIALLLLLLVLIVLQGLSKTANDKLVFFKNTLVYFPWGV